jgi:hypothetical protein
MAVKRLGAWASRPPLAACRASPAARHPHPDVQRHRALALTLHAQRVDLDLGHVGEVDGELRQAQQRVERGLAVGGRAVAPPGEPRAGG